MPKCPLTDQWLFTCIKSLPPTWSRCSMREETLFMAIPTAPRNSDGIRDIKAHGSGGDIPGPCSRADPCGLSHCSASGTRPQPQVVGSWAHPPPARHCPPTPKRSVLGWTGLVPLGSFPGHEDSPLRSCSAPGVQLPRDPRPLVCSFIRQTFVGRLLWALRWRPGQTRQTSRCTRRG